MIDCFRDDALSADVARRWSDFLRTAPSGTFRQSPRWVEIARRAAGLEVRQPAYFRAERDGEIVLAGGAVRRRLPLTPYWTYRFEWGPVFDDIEVFDLWLEVALPKMRYDALSIRMMPRWALADGGDDVETVLERHGFVRRRVEGGWATLVVDLTADEDSLLRSLRRQTRQNVKKCQAAGLKMSVEVDGVGCRSMAGLYDELAVRSALTPIPMGWFEDVACEWMEQKARGGVFLVRGDGPPLAGAVVLVDAGTAYLEILASSSVARSLPASALLVWEVMLWAKAHGCHSLDLCGYSLVTRPDGPLAGINQFKRGFAPAAEPLRYVAEHKLIVRPALESACMAAVRGEARLLRARARSGETHDVITG